MKKPVCPCCKKIIVGNSSPVEFSSDNTENPQVSRKYFVCSNCYIGCNGEQFHKFFIQERNVLKGYAEEPIKTVFESNHIKFERISRKLVDVGYKLSSSSCNSTEGGPLWCAVFILKEAL
jgi:hypothetical protein